MKIKSNLAISDTGFIFNPTTGESFSANTIGATVIKLIKENKSLDEIKTYIVDNFDTDEVTVEKDISDFLFILKQYNILED